MLLALATILQLAKLIQDSLNFVAITEGEKTIWKAFASDIQAVFSLRASIIITTLYEKWKRVKKSYDIWFFAVSCGDVYMFLSDNCLALRHSYIDHPFCGKSCSMRYRPTQDTHPEANLPVSSLGSQCYQININTNTVRRCPCYVYHILQWLQSDNIKDDFYITSSN